MRRRQFLKAAASALLGFFGKARVVDAPVPTIDVADYVRRINEAYVPTATVVSMEYGSWEVYAAGHLATGYNLRWAPAAPGVIDALSDELQDAIRESPYLKGESGC